MNKYFDELNHCPITVDSLVFLMSFTAIVFFYPTRLRKDWNFCALCKNDKTLQLSFADLSNYTHISFHAQLPSAKPTKLLFFFASTKHFCLDNAPSVWPWKNKIYKADTLGNTLLDAQGNPILDNYDRFFPDVTSLQTYIALVYILVGIGIVLWLEWYGKKTIKTSK